MLNFKTGFAFSGRRNIRRIDRFSPAVLFASGEQGIWYDPSDFSSMFQDSAGTTPVTAVGDPVGKINDKSGRGNHATQATGAARPLLQQDGNGKYYLDFDGTDDTLATGSINPGSVDKAQVFVGVRKDVENSGVICETGTNSYTGNGIAVWADDPIAGNTQKWANMGYASSGYVEKYTAAAAPATAVLMSKFDAAEAVAEDEHVMRVNGSVVANVGTFGTSMGSGNFTSNILYIGSRGAGSFRLNGRIYSLIVRFGANLTAQQITDTETWVNGKTGAY
jgi:hypothetical protein